MIELRLAALKCCREPHVTGRQRSVAARKGKGMRIGLEMQRRQRAPKAGPWVVKPTSQQMHQRAAGVRDTPHVLHWPRRRLFRGVG